MKLECDVRVPKDDPVRLLSAIMDRVDYRRINAAYSRLGRNEYPTRLLSKAWIYGYMRRMVHTRAVEAACRENLKFMYLLEGHKAPDHNTLARFRSRVLCGEIGEDLLRQVVELLIQAGFVDMAAVFIDGTKIEANANKYTFVWKKGTEKQREKLSAKVAEQLPALLANAGIKYRLPEVIAVRHLKKIRKKLYAQKQAEGIEFVHGTGKRKTPVQRAIETVDGWIEKYKRYTRDIHICGDRNSYCKTDHDATFMRMKEDHMRNGQLKPGYNVNVATANGFIIGHTISADRSDMQALIPFMKKLREAYPKHHPGRVVVDSGYESEENYCWFEELEDCELYVKPSNHEAKRKKKYRTDISRRENMAYDPDSDTYTCAAGKPIRYDHDKHSKSAGGLNITTSVYVCDHCQGCPLKEKCIRAGSKKPLEERSKVICVSKRFAAQREAMEAKINTLEGRLLRVNRSIQAEGTFALTKQDLDYRRFLCRGMSKVSAEWSLLAIAANILKLHHKLKNDRLGTGLVIPKGFPAGL
ncbi:MAG: IS1182 family transposase [Clostridia bacterium]|nr:IS1182 family transposase [Clostridia bacterium]